LIHAILSLLVACYSLGIFYYCLKKDPPSKGLILFIVFTFLLAGFFNCATTLFTLPGLILILILKGRMRYLLAHRTFQLASLSSIVLILAYLLMREYSIPRYVSNYWHAEFKSALIQPWDHYVKKMFSWNLFYPHILLLIPAILLSFLNKKYAELTVINCIFILCFLIGISIPAIKPEYRDAPVYPFLYLALGLGAAALIDLFRKKNFAVRN
jgi:hypothetical protein